MQFLVLQQGISVRILRKTLPLKNEKIQKSASSDVRNVQLYLKELQKEILLTDHDYAATCNDGKHCYTNSENDNTVVSKKRKICMGNVLSDFGEVRANVFKTQRKTNQTKKTDKQKTELKKNKEIREMRKFHLSLRRKIFQCSICLFTAVLSNSVILLGDFAQLPPVSDKLLYHSVPDNATSLMGYMKFQDLVKSYVNQCVVSGDDNEFCYLLVRLRNGESTISEWELLC